MSFKDSLEDILYKKIIRNLMLTSKLGKQSVLGEASTGYNFDHMYENKAEGLNLIGNIVDRVLLNLPAVQATRNRRSNLVKILRNEILNHDIEKMISRIVDVACGAGRYLTDVTSELKDKDVEIVGVDYDRKSLDLGKAISKRRGISEKNIRFVRGNLFHLKFLKYFGKNIDWRPNIIVASGLTVYIDDDKVFDVIRQAFEALDKGGLFLVDSQESNPSRKLMEKICNTKDGAWILYYRPAEFWRKALYDIGFQSIVITRDKWNMYNVCTARKPA